MIKAIDFFIQSSSNGNISAHFYVGCFYHEGKYVEKDIKKAISYYKKASSFNHYAAKNNLGIIYKHGFGEEIPQNIGVAISYFDEIIRKEKKVLLLSITIYNLAHMYIFMDKSKNAIDEAINLLVKSYIRQDSPLEMLLYIASIIKFGFNLEKIKKELNQKNFHMCNNSKVLIEFNDILLNHWLDKFQKC